LLRYCTFAEFLGGIIIIMIQEAKAIVATNHEVPYSWQMPEAPSFSKQSLPIARLLVLSSGRG
jgi:hypothetical protein